jgi:putative transposase
LARRKKSKDDPFRWFDSSPEVIRRVVMLYVRYTLSLRNVEDLLFERGIDICHETVRHWWNRFGPMFAGEIRRKRVHAMRQFTHWKWHLDEVYVRINGEMRYLWRAVDHEGEVLESFVTKTRDKAAALKFIKKTLKRHGRTKAIVTDGLRSYGAALKQLGAEDLQAPVGRWNNNRAENSHLLERRQRPGGLGLRIGGVRRPPRRRRARQLDGRSLRLRLLGRGEHRQSRIGLDAVDCARTGRAIGGGLPSAAQDGRLD